MPRGATPTPTRPNVLLLIASGCAICPIVHKILTQLNADGKIAQFDVINISQQPQAAEQYGVRSVPWFRIGDLEFTGLHSQSELDYWVTHAQSETGIIRYLTEELEAGHLPAMTQMLRRHPHWLRLSLSIIADMQAPIQARIGLGAIFEDLQGNPQLQALVPELSTLSQHADQRVRGDACYYLGLSGANSARPALSRCAEDPDPEVREIAREALAGLPT
jgi:thioredoxin-like negative regulator of GroEL